MKKIKVIIFGMTYQQANRQLDKILSEIDEIPTVVKRYPNNVSFISFEAIEYRTILINYTTRGYRADRIYIPEDVPLNLYRHIALPTLTDLLPDYDNIKYYKGSDYN